MIGIVVVSHSRPLGEAAVGLATQMVPDGGPHVAVAAGLDDVTLGTDAVAVSEAIMAADSPDGVLVFLDLGSAILSAEMALEFLDADVAARVRITPAALVEGLVAAVVTAATGASLAAVEAAALAGLDAKREHLGEPPQPPQSPAATAAKAASAAVSTLELVAPEPIGLHLRPNARIVAALGDFDAEVMIGTATHEPVHADSIVELATLGARAGEALHVSATGPDAAAALAALETLAAGAFGEQV